MRPGAQGFIWRKRDVFDTVPAAPVKSGDNVVNLPAQQQDWTKKDTVKLARSLLGQTLVRRYSDGTVERRRITEVEAYDGEADLACHARVGRTPRTEILYGVGGQWYVYLCYGVHEMLNLVVGPRNHPAAILIRGVEGVFGPGRVTKHLKINRSLNGCFAQEETGLWVETSLEPVKPHRIYAGPRIGVDFAGPKWASVPWRFILLPEGSRTPHRGHARAKQPARQATQASPSRAEPTRKGRSSRTKGRSARRRKQPSD